jgi:tetratricopeptide (TPR) repeat protein
MERFTKCSVCGASVRTGYMQSLDSGGIADAKRPHMCKFDGAEQCFDRTLELNPKYPPAARNLAMIYLLYGVREKASKDPWYPKESEDYVQEGYF